MERIHVKAECRFSGTAHEAVVLHTDVLMIGLRECYRGGSVKVASDQLYFQRAARRHTVSIIYLGSKAEASPSSRVMTSQQVVKCEVAEVPVPLQGAPVMLRASLCYN